MPVLATHLLTDSLDATGTSYTTASISPASNQLILATIYSRSNSAGQSLAPTLTGNGLTWVQVATLADSATTQRISLFRALGSAVAGTVVIDFGAVTQARCGWSISQFNNVALTGTNGSGAIVQSVTNKDEGTNTGLTVTLAAFGSVNNATYGGVKAGNPITPGTGFAELGEDGVIFIESEWKNSNDTSVDWTWSSTSGFALGVACEIKFASASGGFLGVIS